ncbi:unnamed protein product [Phytophthora fragariaefolia]|uniref:ATP-dependent DNA helicase n=1 Tax=Phytophthora fragariaefolia TaxID=1490495 RepID=A0A9W6TNP8_9STRA|nr:unnamed protein product [Phytophthora fragariaefolia]
MVKPAKSIRAAKAAKRILQRITTQLEPQPRKRRRRRSAPDAAEAGDTEFTRGNSINYWNNAFDVVLDLPRPLSKCVIVYLKTLKAKSTNIFRVHPDLIRRALCWLIDHNPLYKRVRISKKNLAVLRQFDVETNIPTIIPTEEESEALRSTENQVNAEATAPVEDEGQGSIQEQRRSNSPTATDASLSDQSEPMNITCGTTDNKIRDTYDSVFDSTSSSILQQGKDLCVSANAESNDDPVDPLNDLIETLELERSEQSNQSELEKIIQAANLESTEYPVQELQRQTDPIDEYSTKLLMQNCFPTLFLNREGGFNPLSISEGKNEVRVHEPMLAEYRAHLMKWHDRRFVIHRNFKFVCMNLIQRRQSDGLVRRVSDVGSINGADGDAGEPSTMKSPNKDLASAMKIVESLKPYFRVVRGSGLYWANVRDDLMNVSKAADGTPSLTMKLKRDVPTINNYSPALLSTWRANMDIQLIGNAYGAAEYAGAYVSKAEPDTARFRKVIANAVKRCDPNLPYHAILKRVANAALSIREVSAQEAYFTLLRELPMHGKSRTVTRVKVLRHNLRCYRVDTSRVQDLVEFADNVLQTTNRLEPEERAYMSRPYNDLFDVMSFATFVEQYEAVEKLNVLERTGECWKRTDGKGYIKRRAKPHVIKMSPWLKPDVGNADFCFAELFLHVPWRDISSLPQTDEGCIAEFLEEQEKTLDNELRQESNARITRQHNLELLKQSKTSHCCTHLPPSEYVFVEDRSIIDAIPVASSLETPLQQAITREWVAKHEYSVEDIQRAREFIKKNVKPYMKEKREISKFNDVNDCAFRRMQADSGVTNEIMSDSQWIPFALAMWQTRTRFKSKIEGMPCDPLYMIVNGEGGSGKSWLINRIVNDTRNVFYDCEVERNSDHVLLLAHQGTAAFNIKGQTLCSALGFSSFSKSAFSVPHVSLTTQKIGATKPKSLQQRYKEIHLEIIDEFSVISCGMMYWIDHRMREIWPQYRHLRFGGRDIIFTWDAAQLDPVVPYSLSTPVQKIQNDVQRRGRELWEEIENVCMLTSQNRSKNDPEWFNALRRLRKRAPTPADIELFNTICNTNEELPSSFSKAKHIAHKHVDVDTANQESLLAAGGPIIHIHAQHHVQQKRLHRQRAIPEGTVQTLMSEAKQPNSDRDRVVATKVQLSVGAPVTLTFNMEQSAGLCNGTNAIVYDLIFSSDSELPIVLVQITNPYLGPSFLSDVPNIVPIAPKEVSWGKKNSDFRVVRRGIPLRLAKRHIARAAIDPLPFVVSLLRDEPLEFLIETPVQIPGLHHAALGILHEVFVNRSHLTSQSSQSDKTPEPSCPRPHCSLQHPVHPELHDPPVCK